MNQKNEIANKLRSSKLRTTRHRKKIDDFFFNREKTFNFTVEELNKIINKKDNLEKISLATIYNTIDAFKKAGHLKEIVTNDNKSYYDTNISSHHHFFDIETNESEKKIERLKKLSEDRCPVGRLFTEAGYPPRVTSNILPLKG